MIKVVYSKKQVAESGSQISPSAKKPEYMAELLQESEITRNVIQLIEPTAVSINDIKRCHESGFVDGVMNLSRPNGFGTIRQDVVDSLPYTSGAMYTAAKLALNNKYPTAALVSGFHHAGYEGFERFGYFCTFNGLMITATKLIEEDGLRKILIVDADMHFGNGTEEILDIIDPLHRKYMNITFGAHFTEPSHAVDYLNYFDNVREQVKWFKPNMILYQSGADVHVNDPFGGVLDENQMYERDIKMFKIAKDFNIPLAWDLAGGYQIDADGGCGYVLKLHLNTFMACKQVYEL